MVKFYDVRKGKSVDIPASKVKIVKLKGNRYQAQATSSSGTKLRKFAKKPKR